MQNQSCDRKYRGSGYVVSAAGAERSCEFQGHAKIQILNLLGSCEWEGNPKFLKKVTEAARQQAVYYPDFMKIVSETLEPLTAAELQVLRLICADKTNSEIGEILDIKVSTVKSHVSHILQKLSVKRRNEAKTVAEKLKLL